MGERGPEMSGPPPLCASWFPPRHPHPPPTSPPQRTAFARGPLHGRQRRRSEKQNTFRRTLNFHASLCLADPSDYPPCRDFKADRPVVISNTSRDEKRNTNRGENRRARSRGGPDRARQGRGRCPSGRAASAHAHAPTRPPRHPSGPPGCGPGPTPRPPRRRRRRPHSTIPVSAPPPPPNPPTHPPGQPASCFCD